ncbi:MAG: sulfatase-like hydrolase/transferase, partial [Acidobacteria bacterium]|nr:sulfatase-like hydrolase/transferase [Candidatus Sulfomarinibacter sp. MAG AM2]
YDAGWDALAAERTARLRELGLLGESQVPNSRPGWVLAWDDLTPEQQAARSRDMEVYAGMIDYMDQSIGRVLQHLREIDQYDNTVIVFMSDNGPSKTAILDYIALGGEAAEFFEQFDNSLENRGRPGSSTDIGPGWAYASATPLRLFKGYVAQGGIRVPLIVKPAGPLGQVRRVDTPIHAMDLAPTILELAGVHQPAQWRGVEVAPIQGRSLVELFDGDRDPEWMERGLGWEAYGMDAYRRGPWKVLRLPPPYGNGDWQLYNLDKDPGEVQDVAAEHPDLVAELALGWAAYAEANGVIHPEMPVAYARPVSDGKF